MSDEMQDKVKRLLEEADALEKIQQQFPGLSDYEDRWGNKYLKSKCVNSIVNEVWFNHNCGCCPDSPLQAWPYIEVFGRKVHSDPACFIIGERNQFGVGDKEYSGWEEKLRKEGIGEAVISIVREYFINNRARDYTLED